MKNVFYIIIASSFLIGCSTVQFIPEKLSEIEKTDKVIIYIMRPSYFGFGMRFKILSDSTVVGKLGSKGYLSWEVEKTKTPISILSRSENKSELVLNGEKNVYYIKQKTLPGFLYKARTKIIEMDTKEGRTLLKKMKKPKDKSGIEN